MSFTVQSCEINFSRFILSKIHLVYLSLGASQVVLVVRNLPINAGDIRDADLIPGSGRSPGGGHDSSLQYSCLENPWTEEPGGLQFSGAQRVGHEWYILVYTRVLMSHSF